MVTTKRPSVLRRLMPWLVATATAQLALHACGLLLARRLDVGEDSSSRIRRVRTMGQLVLAPRSQDLARLQLDLVMAGAQVDLTGARPAPGGLDVIVTVAMAGAEVKIPEAWRVSWVQRGPGGVEVPGSLTEADPASADVRLDVRTLAGGVSLQAV